LFLAERAWSQSSSLRKSDDDAHGKRRHHTHRRLSKAVHFAEQLSSLLESEDIQAEEITLLEARAYTTALVGQYSFESKRWDVALRNYSISKVILETLLSKAHDSALGIYKEFSGIIDPGLRYCAYQLQLANHSDIFALAIAHLPRDESLLSNLKSINPSILDTKTTTSVTAGGINSVQWRRHTAQIIHPEIAVQLAKLRDVQFMFSDRVSTFPLSATETASSMDDLLNAWAETQDAVKKVMEESVGMSQEKEQGLQIILTYVSFHGICERVRRDLLLVKELEQRRAGQRKMAVLKDLVRLHDSIIQVALKERGVDCRVLGWFMSCLVLLRIQS
jgi:hypothetical protein